MSIFEHIMALLSFILSLGVASLMTQLAAMIQGRDRLVFSWPFALWFLVIFLGQIVFWLNAYSFHAVERTTPTGLLLVLGLSLVTYMQCAMLIPREAGDAALDLREHHRLRRREYIGAVLLSDLLTVVLLWYEARLNGTPLAFMAPLYITVALDLAALLLPFGWAQWLAPSLLLVIRGLGVYYGAVGLAAS